MGRNVDRRKRADGGGRSRVLVRFLTLCRPLPEIEFWEQPLHSLVRQALGLLRSARRAETRAGSLRLQGMDASDKIAKHLLSVFSVEILIKHAKSQRSLSASILHNNQRRANICCNLFSPRGEMSSNLAPEPPTYCLHRPCCMRLSPSVKKA